MCYWENKYYVKNHTVQALCGLFPTAVITLTTTRYCILKGSRRVYRRGAPIPAACVCVKKFRPGGRWTTSSVYPRPSIQKQSKQARRLAPSARYSANRSSWLWPAVHLAGEPRRRPPRSMFLLRKRCWLGEGTTPPPLTVLPPPT